MPRSWAAASAVGDLRADLDRLAHRDRAAVEPLAQGLAFQQLHDEVGGAVLRADVVDGDDVGMIESGDGARFLLEAAQAVAVGGDGLWQDLDGDLAIEPGVASAINFAHSTVADGSDDLVRPEFCRGCKRHTRCADYNQSLAGLSALPTFDSDARVGENT